MYKINIVVQHCVNYTVNTIVTQYKIFTTAAAAVAAVVAAATVAAVAATIPVQYHHDYHHHHHPVYYCVYYCVFYCVYYCGHYYYYYFYYYLVSSSRDLHQDSPAPAAAQYTAPHFDQEMPVAALRKPFPVDRALSLACAGKRSQGNRVRGLICAEVHYRHTTGI